jgi:outer membrane protein
MRTVLVFILFFLLSFVVYAQEELTLVKSIQIALHKNSSLQKSVNGIGGYESDVLASYGNFLPTLGLGGGWDWRRNEVKVSDVTVEEQTRSYSAGVSSNWTLFDGLSNFASLSQSQNNLKSAEYSLDRLKQDIVFQTTSLYYDIINTGKLLEVKEDNLKWNEKNLETIKERNKLGAATLADVYQQQVATGNAELQIITTKNQLEVAKNNLLFYLGLDVLEDYTFDSKLSKVETDILDSDLSSDYEKIAEYVAQAMNSRYDYKSAMLNLEGANDGVTIARSGHLPSLSANGSYFWGGDRLSNIENSKTLSFGLTLNIPLFSGWAVDNRVQFAQVDLKNKEIELNDLQRDIKRQLQTTFLDLQAAFKALKVSENNVAFAQENLRIEQEKYSLGSGKLLDVLIANSNYTTALTDLINAQYSYIVLSEQLKYHLGILDFTKYE